MFRRFSLRLLMLGMLAIFFATDAFALTSAYIGANRRSDTVFDIVATGLVNVGALEIDIKYTQAAFQTPQVTLGPLAGKFMSAANPNFGPGQIKIGMAAGSGVTGDGTIATVVFAPNGNPADGTISLSGKGYTAEGQPLGLTFFDPRNAKVEDNNPPPPPTDTKNPSNPPNPQENQNPQNPPSGGNITGGTITVTGGETLNLPGRQGGQGFDETLSTVSGTGAGAGATAEGYPSPVPAASQGGESGTTALSSVPSTGQKAPGQEKFVSYRSVVQSFREFTGERTPKALMALFKTANIPGFTQTPAIALSDGVDTVTLTIRPFSSGMSAPNFALTRARLMSLKKNAAGDWVIEARPEKGTYQATLTVIQDDNVVEYPLTIAPPVEVKIDKSGPALGEADFVLFLKERGDAKAPKYDLNKDGKRDYLDDYIYAANYLVVIGKPKPVEKK
jgi:hypothetical protein